MSKVTRADIYVIASRDTETLRVVQHNDENCFYYGENFYIAHGLALFDQKVGLQQRKNTWVTDNCEEKQKKRNTSSLKYFAIFFSNHVHQCIV